jgi:hypothetical protein
VGIVPTLPMICKKTNGTNRIAVQVLGDRVAPTITSENAGSHLVPE